MWSLLASLIRDLWSVLPGRSLRDWDDVALVPNRPTVILVSGFGASARTLTVLRKRLLRDSFNVIVLSLDLYSLADGVRGFMHSVEKLSALVLRLKKQTALKGGHLFIVAHSVGGLVARHYVQRLGGSHYTDGLITLGTPHQGTWFALLGFFTHLILKGRCLLQMTPVSNFITNVNSAPYPDGYPYCHVYSQGDFMCPPRATALPKKVKEQIGVQTFEMSALSHSDFLMSKRAYLLIRSCLVQMERTPKIEAQSA